MRTALAAALFAALTSTALAQTDDKAVCSFRNETTLTLASEVGQLMMKLERALAEPVGNAEVARTMQRADEARLKALPSLVALNNALQDLQFQLAVCASR